MTFRDWINSACSQLESIGLPTPRLDAQMLASYEAGRDRSWVLAHLDDQFEHADLANVLLERRTRHEPLGYILGEREFYGRRFIVRPGVLIPRQETETLVEAALESIDPEHCASVLDLGTGSGAIGITIKLESPLSRVVCSDLSPAALEIARENAAALSADLEFMLSDAFGSMGSRQFEIIVSNPPYVGRGDALPKEVSEFEPEEALYADHNGMGFHERLAREAPDHLVGPRILIVEVGDRQSDIAAKLFQNQGWSLTGRRRDLDGTVRVLAFRLP